MTAFGGIFRKESKMGRIITCKCDSCDKQIELYEGQGIRDNKIDHILAYFDTASKTKIKNALSKNSKAIKWSFYRQIAYSNVDHTIKSVPTLFLTDGKTVTPIENIYDGDKGIEFVPAERLLNGAFHFVCPECGKKMTCIMTGFWD